MTHLVNFANALSKDVGRSIEMIHMPVPKERHDDAYFAPLAQLKMPAATQLFHELRHQQLEGGSSPLSRLVIGRGQAKQLKTGLIIRGSGRHVVGSWRADSGSASGSPVAAGLKFPEFPGGNSNPSGRVRL